MTRHAAWTLVSTMTARELDAIITGRNRLGDTQQDQLLIWNAAIDEERDR